ncbi:hypothetical protein [Pseudolysinimonas sp.]|uniref:hypothetical protein n=1 Tax=Pseudolysinimonas sp. TaxID=2680009 RepID=UPI003F812505
MTLTIYSVFALLLAAICIAWGAIGLLRSRWMVRLNHRLMRRAWGQSIADSTIYPARIRRLMFGFLLFGALLIASVFLFPNMYVGHR